MKCNRCGKWCGASAVLPGQPTDHLCMCQHLTTFDELFKEHNLTAEERHRLVVFLATMRAQKTIQALTNVVEAADINGPHNAAISGGTPSAA